MKNIIEKLTAYGLSVSVPPNPSFKRQKWQVYERGRERVSILREGLGMSVGHQDESESVPYYFTELSEVEDQPWWKDMLVELTPVMMTRDKELYRYPASPNKHLIVYLDECPWIGLLPPDVDRLVPWHEARESNFLQIVATSNFGLTELQKTEVCRYIIRGLNRDMAHALRDALAPDFDHEIILSDQIVRIVPANEKHKLGDVPSPDVLRALNLKCALLTSQAEVELLRKLTK